MLIVVLAMVDAVDVVVVVHSLVSAAQEVNIP